MLAGLAKPGLAQFTCDSGSLTGNCTVSTSQNVTGNTTVAGDLTITSTGELKYGSATAEINVGGDLTVDGTISAKSAKGANGSNGSNGSSPTPGGDGVDGGTVTFNVCRDFTQDFPAGSGAEITAKGGNGGTPGNGGNGKGGGSKKGAGGDGGDGGIVTVNADGQITINGDVIAIGSKGKKGGNGFPKGAAGADGTDGSITFATALSSVTIGGGVIDPAAGIFTGQSLICPPEDPLPDDTTTFTQGHYGSSPSGEAKVDDILELSIDPTPTALCEEIVHLLNDSGFTDMDIAGGTIDCTSSTDRDAVALFITGEVGNAGGNNDDGFLPAGNPSLYGSGRNLEAQKITLLLNLSLDAILTGDDIPLEGSYFLNIDPVADFVGGVFDRFYDPILTVENNELGTCVDTTPADDVCDGSPTLTPLGVVVTALDETTLGSAAEGTTVAEILAAADDLIHTGDDDIEVNGVTVTRGDMTAILGLINESYHEGTPTGFVTAFDID